MSKPLLEDQPPLVSNAVAQGVQAEQLRSSALQSPEPTDIGQLSAEAASEGPAQEQAAAEAGRAKALAFIASLRLPDQPSAAADAVEDMDLSEDGPR